MWIFGDQRGDCGGQIMAPPKMSMSQSLETEWITLHGKRDFADGIKVMDFKIGRLSWMIPVGPI